MCSKNYWKLRTAYKYGQFSNIINSDVVLENVLGLEDRFVKSLALASTVLSLASALLGLGFCAVLGSRTRYFLKFNFAIVFTKRKLC